MLVIFLFFFRDERFFFHLIKRMNDRWLNAGLIFSGTNGFFSQQDRQMIAIDRVPDAGFSFFPGRTFFFPRRQMMARLYFDVEFFQDGDFFFFKGKWLVGLCELKLLLHQTVLYKTIPLSFDIYVLMADVSFLVKERKYNVAYISLEGHFAALL